MELWPVTAEIAAIVRPWVSGPTDVGSDAWLISSGQATDAL
jgi:hypothetical protein